jgi:hypothetical protein
MTCPLHLSMMFPNAQQFLPWMNFFIFFRHLLSTQLLKL